MQCPAARAVEEEKPEERRGEKRQGFSQSGEEPGKIRTGKPVVTKPSDIHNEKQPETITEITGRLPVTYN
jgi:hypothetical protein